MAIIEFISCSYYIVHIYMYLASEVIAVSTHGFWLSMAFNIGPYLATEVYNCYYPHRNNHHQLKQDHEINWIFVSVSQVKFISMTTTSLTTPTSHCTVKCHILCHGFDHGFWYRYVVSNRLDIWLLVFPEFW